MASDPLNEYLSQRPLRLLTARARQLLQGKWLANGHEFLRRAAFIRQRHAALQPLAISSADIEAASARVALLERALAEQQRLCQEIADTLLQERAEAYGMGRLVLQTVEALGHLPHLPDGDTAPLRQAAAFLRFEFDARRRKISAARRQQTLARQAAAPAPPPKAPPPEGRTAPETPEPRPPLTPIPASWDGQPPSVLLSPRELELIERELLGPLRHLLPSPPPQDPPG